MHLKSLFYKFLFTAGILLIYLSYVAKTNLGWNLVIASIVALSTYLIGDLLILPAAGNIISAIIDVVLSAVVIWLMQYAIPGFVITFMYALYAGIALGGFELIFHNYMEKHTVSRT